MDDPIISPLDDKTLLYRGVRTRTFTYRGKSAIVEFPGYYPLDGDEGIHTVADMEVSDAALLQIKKELGEEK